MNKRGGVVRNCRVTSGHAVSSPTLKVPCISLLAFEKITQEGNEEVAEEEKEEEEEVAVVAATVSNLTH